MKTIIDNIAVATLILSAASFLIMALFLFYSFSIYFGITVTLSILAITWLIYRK